MLLVYIGLLVLFIIQPNTDLKFTNKKSFCITSGIFLFAIGALRNITHGDLIGYSKRYSNVLPNSTYAGLFEDWINGDLKDFGFHAWSKIFTDIGVSVELWIILICAIFCVCFSYFTYKYSEDPFLSVFILLIFYYVFTFTGLRQTMALAVLFFAYKFMMERKPWKFVISVILASCFHSAALVFLPAYFISRLRIGIKQIAVVILSLMTSIFAPGVFRKLIDLLAWNEALEGYADRELSLSWAGYIIQLCIFIFVMVYRNGIDNKDNNNIKNIDMLINCITVGLCIQGFSNTIAEAFRLSYFYSIGIVALLPNIILLQKNKDNRRQLYLLVVLILMAYMIWKKAYFDYTFFWQ